MRTGPLLLAAALLLGAPAGVGLASLHLGSVGAPLAGPSAGVLRPGAGTTVVETFDRPFHAFTVELTLAGAPTPQGGPPAWFVWVLCGWGCTERREPACWGGLVRIPEQYFDAYVGLRLVASDTLAFQFAAEESGAVDLGEPCPASPP